MKFLIFMQWAGDILPSDKKKLLFWSRLPTNPLQLDDTEYFYRGMAFSMSKDDICLIWDLVLFQLIAILGHQVKDLCLQSFQFFGK